MSRPRKGARVTVLRDGTPVPAKIQELSVGWRQRLTGNGGVEPRRGNTFNGFEDGTLGGFYEFADENITWCRGGHKKDSPKVHALEVAAALR